MKTQTSTWLINCTALMLAVTGSASAEVHYVDLNSVNPTQPYTNWATAATNIQDAVDAAAPGDEVVVTNGVHANDGRNPDRAEVDDLGGHRNVNGPRFTAIEGNVANGGRGPVGAAGRFSG